MYFQTKALKYLYSRDFIRSLGRMVRGPPVCCEQGRISTSLSFQIDDPNSSLEEVTDEAEAVRSVSKLGSNQAFECRFPGF